MKIADGQMGSNILTGPARRRSKSLNPDRDQNRVWQPCCTEKLRRTILSQCVWALQSCCEPQIRIQFDRNDVNLKHDWIAIYWNGWKELKGLGIVNQISKRHMSNASLHKWLKSRPGVAIKNEQLGDPEFTTPQFHLPIRVRFNTSSMCYWSSRRGAVDFDRLMTQSLQKSPNTRRGSIQGRVWKKRGKRQKRMTAEGTI